MPKWADFVIIKVKYNRDRTQLEEVETRVDTGDALSSDPGWMTRQQVVEALPEVTFVTAYPKDGKWTRGEDVRVVTIRGEHFLRTDSNAVKADNLGELPEYV